MSTSSPDPVFPCSLTISTPLPSARLASCALRALEVDKELSPLVCRSLSLALSSHGSMGADSESQTVLKAEYKASTNRMLRVAVNGFMESLGLILGVMKELDVDVLSVISSQASKGAQRP